MTDIVMPQLGETVTEGTITRWNKAVGDAIEEDEVLFEVSTDKVDSEVPSPTSGFVSEILVAEGDTVDIGVKLAVISAEAGGAAPPAAPAEPPAEPEKAEKAPQEEVAEAPAPSPSSVVEAAPPPEPAPAPDTKLNGKVLSPVVRKLIAEHGIDPTAIPGTGQGGRITRNDVLTFIDQTKQASASAPELAAAPVPAPAPAPTPTPSAAPAARPAPPAVPRGGQVIPFSNIRRRTAEHMVRSLATSAHTLVVFEVDYAGVDKVRNAAKGTFKTEEGVSLTYLPFIARATIDAIREFPFVNATVGNDELQVHGEVNLGIAVDLNFEGLIVPVVHDAGSKRLAALAREMADLASRANARKLSADDISGGTFTITNAGGFGTMLTAPVINQPQVAILSTDGIKKKPVVVESPDGTDAIAIHPMGNLALSFDHRANDGAYASAFLARIKEILETRDWSIEL